MNVPDILKLLAALEPAAQAAVGAIVKAFHDKDPEATRLALEAALRFQFEARQAAKS